MPSYKGQKIVGGAIVIFFEGGLPARSTLKLAKKTRPHNQDQIESAIIWFWQTFSLPLQATTNIH